jgi:DNA-binding GntR family transcriptional regulator
VEHKRLFEAIKAHDPIAAADAMATHLDSAMEAIRAGRSLQRSPTFAD